MKRLLSAILAFALAGPALAQGYLPNSVSAQPCSATVIPTIVTGGTAQTVITAKQAAHGFALFNTDTSEAMWVSLNGSAVIGGGTLANSFPIAPGAATTFAGIGNFITPFGFGTGVAVSLNATTSGHKFACYVW